MNMLSLNKQKTDDFEFDELYRMLSELEDFLNEDIIFRNDWKNENLDIIIDFQDSDGSFKLFDSYKIPSEAVIDFCFVPTYLCTAILMKAYMTDSRAFSLKEKSALKNGLIMSSARNLYGHGFGGFKEQIDALNIFMKAGLNEFIDLYPDFCPKFTGMIKKIISKFEEMEFHREFIGPWGESYESDIKAVNEYFSNRNVFVYGTLMHGECNHYCLQNSTFLSLARIHGYSMYDVGWYPAIIPGHSSIPGELYRVPKEDMSVIDTLEGEGDLYIKKCERVKDLEGNSSFAFVYVYLGDCSDLKRIPAWKEYVWYVSYGSNMLKERFDCYIEGGSYEGSTPREPCRDTTPPAAVKTVEIPYDMYFGNHSGSWEYGGVSFLDTSKKGSALGVAYLITKEQFDHVATQENGGRYPEEGYNWYENIIDLETMDGFEVKTITNNILREYNEPCQAYLDTLHQGIKKNWPEMSDEDIDDYLNRCIR